jgi:hypothetical protein
MQKGQEGSVLKENLVLWCERGQVDAWPKFKWDGCRKEGTHTLTRTFFHIAFCIMRVDQGAESAWLALIVTQHG